LGISPASVGNILKLHRETGGLESRPQTHVRTQSKLSLKILSFRNNCCYSQGAASLKEIEKEIIEHGHSDSDYIYLYFIVLLLVNPCFLNKSAYMSKSSSMDIKNSSIVWRLSISCEIVFDV
jgi:hypothetical protein